MSLNTTSKSFHVVGADCAYVNSLYLFCVFQLAYCVVQFLEKDPTLTEPVLFKNLSSHSKHKKAQSTKLVYTAEKSVVGAANHPLKQTVECGVFF